MLRRTQSILASPVLNNKKKVVGVLQLINKLDDTTHNPISFQPSDEAIVEHFSSEIGDALESGARIEESKHKFESHLEIRCFLLCPEWKRRCHLSLH